MIPTSEAIDVSPDFNTFLPVVLPLQIEDGAESGEKPSEVGSLHLRVKLPVPADVHASLGRHFIQVFGSILSGKMSTVFH